MSGPASSSAVARARVLWDHPVGPKTVFFWGPIVKWCLVLAGLKDIQRPVEKLSVSQNVALAATGFIWTRWSLVIIPKNYPLAAVNFFVGCTGLYQLGRVYQSVPAPIIPPFGRLLTQSHDLTRQIPTGIPGSYRKWLCQCHAGFSHCQHLMMLPRELFPGSAAIDNFSALALRFLVFSGVSDGRIYLSPAAERTFGAPSLPSMGIDDKE
ncbi:UPF0041-domain-containing protein [Auricularia subglabra TFB-10046 SS5]|nr:UPF0041-domain-containing protein [Auricularia subglabra TFB-10046 SS5]